MVGGEVGALPSVAGLKMAAVAAASQNRKQRSRIL